MLVSLPIAAKQEYAVAEAALRRWVSERVRAESRADGGVVYLFRLCGSTCNNVPIEVMLTVSVGADGRVEAASALPSPGDGGCDAMCAVQGSTGERFLALAGACEEAVGLTLEDAAFREWEAEPSGCFCTAGNRRHKWRNVFQALHYAASLSPPRLPESIADEAHYHSSP